MAYAGSGLGAPFGRGFGPIRGIGPVSVGPPLNLPALPPPEVYKEILRQRFGGPTPEQAAEATRQAQEWNWRATQEALAQRQAQEEANARAIQQTVATPAPLAPPDVAPSPPIDMGPLPAEEVEEEYEEVEEEVPEEEAAAGEFEGWCCGMGERPVGPSLFRRGSIRPDHFRSRYPREKKRLAPMPEIMKPGKWFGTLGPVSPSIIEPGQTLPGVPAQPGVIVRQRRLKYPRKMMRAF